MTFLHTMIGQLYSVKWIHIVVSFPLLLTIGCPVVWMMRMMKICQWRLRLSGKKCGEWQTTHANDYVCGTSTRLLRSSAACVSSTWAMRNHRPNWSYCNRPLTLYSTWSSKFEVSGCPGRKEKEGKGLFAQNSCIASLPSLWHVLVLSYMSPHLDNCIPRYLVKIKTIVHVTNDQRESGHVMRKLSCVTVLNLPIGFIL